MAYYENVFIARQDIAVSQVDALSSAFTKIIEEGGGKVTKKEDWGLRAFAYKIKKSRKGYYVLFNIDAPSDAVKEMERQMRLHDDVLRYLTIRLEELDDSPSLMANNSHRHEEQKPRYNNDSKDADVAKKTTEAANVKEKVVDADKGDDK